MRKIVSFLIVICLIVGLISCEESNSLEKVNAIKTVSERVSDLNKTISEIKSFEDKDALSRDEKQYLEYLYPIREDESYVVGYRFFDAVCFEIGITTYFNNKGDAKKVRRSILHDLKENSDFEASIKEKDFYQWRESGSTTKVELNTQGIERGIIALRIISN